MGALSIYGIIIDILLSSHNMDIDSYLLSNDTIQPSKQQLCCLLARYTFTNDFELQAKIVDRLVSINFLTKKMLIRENVNSVEVRGLGRSKFKETTTTFVFPKLIQLRSISDIDELDVESLLAPSR